MADRARAFWIAEPGRGEIREETLPALAEGDVLVRALFSGVSRGTESLVFHGRVPRSEYGRMRAPFQAGQFPAPVKYGYANVGIVERGPHEVAGRTVFALYPHQTHFVIPANAVCVVPDSVPPERAVLAANLETAINGLWDLRPHVGDRITVIGAGTIGCLVAWLAAGVRGCDVELVDVEPRRHEIARCLGVRFVEPGAATSGADAVVHCSGSAAGLELALGVAGSDSVVVEMSWYGDRIIPVPLGARFHSERLTIKSSQVGRIADSQRARWSNRRRIELALAMLSDPVLDRLITGESAFEELPAVMPTLTEDAGKTLCHRIRY